MIEIAVASFLVGLIVGLFYSLIVATVPSADLEDRHRKLMEPMETYIRLQQEAYERKRAYMEGR